MKYSIITPVYNRPQEIDELLDSLTKQTYKDFEVVIIEDGSKIDCKVIVEKYASELVIQYHVQQNGGPSAARNTGFSIAQGEYFVLFDSDCIIPPDYLAIVNACLMQEKYDAYGGPEKAMSNFNAIQKATGYTMTSFLTTGGIRGSKIHVGTYQPRSYNMGLSRQACQTVGGFAKDMRFGEDIDLSIRLYKANLKVGLIADAYVYHKRRTTLKQFFKQVFQFGTGRVDVYRRHPNELKITHLFPAVFTLFLIFSIIAPFVHIYGLVFPVFALVYLKAISIGAWLTHKSWVVSFYAFIATLLQMSGYGAGLLWRLWQTRK